MMRVQLSRHCSHISSADIKFNPELTLLPKSSFLKLILHLAALNTTTGQSIRMSPANQRWRQGRYAGGQKLSKWREASKFLRTTPFILAQNSTKLSKNIASKLWKCQQCIAIFKSSSADRGLLPPSSSGCAIPAANLHSRLNNNKETFTIMMETMLAKIVFSISDFSDP